MSVRSFLATIKTQLETSKGPLRFVTGNQSADLDSVISAISYSYFSNLKDKNEYIIPLINIPREDLKLRRDIVLVLSAHSISEDLLYFVEDFARLTKSQTKTELVLVDHCNLQGDILTDAYQQKRLEVVAIIDHHADEGIALDAKPRIVHSNGSCSSLVFNYWYDCIGEKTEFYKDIDVILLLLAPLLIDTSNMTQKVEEGDEVAFAKYKEILNLPGNKTLTDLESSEGAVTTKLVATEDNIFERFYTKTKSEKKNVKGFSVSDLLRKDYKQFEFQAKKLAIRIGFSSLLKAMSWILSTYTHDEVVAACIDVCKINDLDVIVMTPSYTRKDNDEYTREFAYSFNKDSKNAEFFHQLAELTSPVLELNDNVYSLDKAELSQINNNKHNQVLEIYNQVNIRASRKQVVPAVKDVVEAADI